MSTYVKIIDNGFIPVNENEDDAILVEENELQVDEMYTCIEEYVENKFRFRIEKKPLVFNISFFKSDLKTKLGVRMIDLYDMWGVINDNLKNPMTNEHFSTIGFFIKGWLNNEKITQDDYNNFVTCFLNQSINIEDY